MLVLDHVCKLTGLKIAILSPDRSEQLQWFCDRQLISVTMGAKHHAELELDRGKAGQIFDFNPLLPLSIRW